MNTLLFTCSDELERWTGKINKFIKYHSHYEIRIESRSSITVLFGETTCGNFACMPDFGAGCHLARFDDVFYNTEKLINVMNPVDAITVAKALAVISKELC